MFEKVIWSHFLLILPPGIEAGGLPSGQERANQPNDCWDRQFVWLSHSHIQRHDGPVWLFCPQHWLLIWTEQEHLWSTRLFFCYQLQSESLSRHHLATYLCNFCMSCLLPKLPRADLVQPQAACLVSRPSSQAAACSSRSVRLPPHRPPASPSATPTPWVRLTPAPW